MDSSTVRLNAITQRLICTAIVLCLLYVGKDILMPTVVAVVLGFGLMPLVRRLQRLGLNRGLSVAVVVALTCVLLGNVVLNMGAQLVRIAESLPQYETNIRDKMNSLDELTLGRLTAMVEKADAVVGRFGKADQRSQKTNAAGIRDSTDVVTVRLEEQAQTPQAVIGQMLGSVARFAENAGLALVVLIFVLLDYEVLRDRLIRLVGGRNLRETTTALNEAGNKLMRYFGAQIAVNALSGVVVGLSLHWLGVPEAMFWGALTSIARFIPYVGAWGATAAVSLMAAAVSPGWSLALASLGLFVALEVIVSQIVEPKLYGHTTGLSPLSVVIGAIFWAALWGPVGLVLATPLTLLLVVAGRYVPALRFIELLLGDVPGLSAAERFYQRALAGDARELVVNLRQYLRKKSASEYCDHVLLPFISLAKEDFSQRAITQSEIENLTQTITAILRLLEQPARSKNAADHSDADAANQAGAVRVISQDDPVSDMYARAVLALFKSNGVPATLFLAQDSADDPRVATDEARAVVVTASDSGSLSAQTTKNVTELADRYPGRRCFAFIPGVGVLDGRSLPDGFPVLLSSCRQIQSLCDELHAK